MKSKFRSSNIQATFDVAKGKMALSNLYHTVDYHYNGDDRNDWLKKIKKEIKMRGTRLLSKKDMEIIHKKELERELSKRRSRAK